MEGGPLTDLSSSGDAAVLCRVIGTGRNAVPSEDTPSYDRENPAEEHWYFDELAKELADAALSRGWVLKLALSCPPQRAA